MKKYLKLNVTKSLDNFLNDTNLREVVLYNFDKYFLDSAYSILDTEKTFQQISDEINVRSGVLINLDIYNNKNSKFNYSVSRAVDEVGNFVTFVPRHNFNLCYKEYLRDLFVLIKNKAFLHNLNIHDLTIFDEDFSDNPYLASQLVEAYKAYFDIKETDTFVVELKCSKRFNKKYEELLDLKDFIVNCTELSSGIVLVERNFLGEDLFKRVPYQYSKDILEKYASIPYEKQFLNFLNQLNLAYNEYTYGK